jgi:hypothetical protein
VDDVTAALRLLHRNVADAKGVRNVVHDVTLA